MARGRHERRIVTRVAHGGAGRSVRREPDELAVEEPLSIQLDGTLVATTMCTPGNDYELAAGFCFTEGLLGGAMISGVRYCAGGSAVDSGFNVVTVETGGAAPPPVQRLGNVGSSCGLCGSEQLDSLTERLSPLPDDGAPVDFDLLAAVPDSVKQDQSLFGATGAVHAAAAFDGDGQILLVREDIGRHNAVDKVVGALLLQADGALPASGLGLFVSGRASIEMVQKAWAAGFSTLLAASAPTSLAVDAARRANLVLAGFLRPGGFNVYSPERVVA
ncbi:MAG: formate dehydrogenase accessory sulfurtransferase FdhD [Acidimicrobiia bacterium]|nr:formate dehydrogenase accessory sulfurtransferase FdhD [Acidimicrobiia bacterium]